MSLLAFITEQRNITARRFPRYQEKDDEEIDAVHFINISGKTVAAVGFKRTPCECFGCNILLVPKLMKYRK